jgi:hypothetical protein
MLYPQFGRPLGQRRHYVAGHGEAVILLWRSQPAADSTIPPSRGWPAWFVPPPCHKLPGEKIAEPGDMTARSTGSSGAAVPRAIDAGGGPSGLPAVAMVSSRPDVGAGEPDEGTTTLGALPGRRARSGRMRHNPRMAETCIRSRMQEGEHYVVPRGPACQALAAAARELEPAVRPGAMEAIRTREPPAPCAGGCRPRSPRTAGKCCSPAALAIVPAAPQPHHGGPPGSGSPAGAATRPHTPG